MTEAITVTDPGAAGTALLERESELAQLDAVLTHALNGSGRVVLVHGPAGIGKTRLLEETRRRARAIGIQVLAARGGELEGGHGFGVVRQLLETAVFQARRDDRDDVLDGAARFAQSVFSAPAPGPAAASQTVLHGLYWLVANLAERSPLLLAVDDVQWADGPSLRFLLYLARRLEGMPVALTLALRSGEESPHHELLGALRLEAHPPVLEPSRLSLQASHALTQRSLGREASAELARACHEASRGNPFLLMELLHQLRGRSGGIDAALVGRTTSDRITAAILLRIGRIGTPAPALARAISVLGASADVETAAMLAQIDVSAAANVADALAQAEILEPGPAYRLRFVHPLVRTAVYEDMPRSERVRLHARAARLLGARHGAPDEAAVHLLLTDPAGDAGTVELLRQAARAALARGAPETAVEFLRRAEREPPSSDNRTALLLELGVAASRAGQADGVERLREAFRLAAAQPARGLAGLELSFALGVSSSRSGEAIPVLARAREGLQDESLRTLLDARLLMFASCVCIARPGLSAQLREARAAIDRPAGDALLALQSALSVDLLFTEGLGAREICQLAERALAGGQLMRSDIERDWDFALGAVFALMYAGRAQTARHHLDDGVAYARARGSPFGVARICACRALVEWRLGELSTAESDALSPPSVGAAWGIPHAISSAVLAQVRMQRGDLDGARAALDRVDVDPAVLDVSLNQTVREARAGLLMAEGKPREALTELRAYARWERQSAIESRLAPVAWRSMAALALLQLDEVDEARELATLEVGLARQFGAGPQLGAALRALALIEGGTRGLTLLHEAVSVLEASEARLDHARALVDLGALLRRCGRHTGATDALRAGRELAHGCAATALAEFAAAQLRLAGARPRRIALSGRDSLTPSERRVTDLATQRMSNKQIAQALFVTLRTVEMHLSNAYRKLGISSRDELPAALGPR